MNGVTRSETVEENARKQHTDAQSHAGSARWRSLSPYLEMGRRRHREFRAELLLLGGLVAKSTLAAMCFYAQFRFFWARQFDLISQKLAQRG